MVVGTGPQSLYFALGEKCDELLKSAIDKSAEVGEQSVPPVQCVWPPTAGGVSRQSRRGG